MLYYEYKCFLISYCLFLLKIPGSITAIKAPLFYYKVVKLTPTLLLRELSAITFVYAQFMKSHYMLFYQDMETYLSFVTKLVEKSKGINRFVYVLHLTDEVSQNVNHTRTRSF